MKEKKQKTWVLQAQLISLLRRLFVKSPSFSAVKKAARRERIVLNKDGSPSKAKRFEFQCADCKGWFVDGKTTYNTVDKRGKAKSKTVSTLAVDHTDPVIPPTGFPRQPNGDPDWNIIIERMFLGVYIWNPEDTFDKIKGRAQLLCWSCHNIKSQIENAQRREATPQKTKEKKPKKGK